MAPRALPGLAADPKKVLGVRWHRDAGRLIQAMRRYRAENVLCGEDPRCLALEKACGATAADSEEGASGSDTQ